MKEPSEPKIVRFPQSVRPAPARVLFRERLLRKLGSDAGRLGVWVAGPAGSGKTTVVSAYLQQRRCPYLWLQLDETDIQPATFFGHLKQAADRVFPAQVQLPHLTPEYLGGLAAFTRRFFDLLYQRLGQGIVVFDDVHLLSGQVWEALIPLWFRHVPDGLRLILISRQEPPPSLARLLIYGQLGRIDWQDLRLTETEVFQLAAVMQDDSTPRLEQDTLRRIHRETDGWMAGVVLMLSQPNQRPTLSTQNRQLLFEYFATEMMTGLSGEIRWFLLKTALLPVIDIPAARHLTGNERAGQILEELCQRQLFTSRHPDQAEAYRYHPLLRQFLLARLETALTDGELTALRRQAAALLAASGQTEAAAALYIASGDWEALAGLILANAQSLIAQGRLELLEGWLRALPRVHLEREPWLWFWLGNCRLPFDPPSARECFEKSFAGFRAAGETTGACMAWAAIAETFQLHWQDFKPLDHWIGVLDTLQRDAFPLPPEAEARLACGAVAALLFRQPQHPSMSEWVSRAGACVADQSLPSELRMTIAFYLGIYASWIGDIASLDSFSAAMREMADLPQCTPLNRIKAKLLGAIAGWITAGWMAAERELQQGLEIVKTSGVQVMAHELLAQGVYIHAGGGDIEQAERYLSQMGERLASAPRLGMGHYHYLRGWLFCLAGDEEQARAHARLALESSLASGTPFQEALCRLALAQTALSVDDRREALVQLRQALRLARSVRSRLLRFHGGCLKAWLALKAGRQGRGLADLRRTLTLGRECAFVNVPWLTPGLLAFLAVTALAHGIETDYVRHLIHTRRLKPHPPPVHLESWPWPVRIYTLGRFSLVIDDRPLSFSGKAQKRPLELLQALIALGGRGVAVETLAEALWPDSEGDAGYQVVLANVKRLRRLLEDKEAIELSAGRVALNPERCWVDVWAFERMTGEAETLMQRKDTREAGLERLQRAVALYHGPFLAQGSEASWVLPVRQRLERRFVDAVLQLGGWMEEEERWQQASEQYHKALASAPFAEAFYQRLIGCHLQMGQRAEVVRIYRQCEQMLQQLGLVPSEQTRSLLRQAQV